MKQKYIDTYMKMAEEVANLSHAVRLKVGTVIVSPQDLICIGFNGTPSGWDNCCEDIIPEFEEVEIDSRTVWYAPEQTVTKKEVLHSESNALMKAAREGFSLKGSTLLCTHSCCLSCAKLIHQAGVKEVIYKEQYRDTTGLEFLKKCNVIVTQYKPIDEEA